MGLKSLKKILKKNGKFGTRKFGLNLDLEIANQMENCYTSQECVHEQSCHLLDTTSPEAVIDTFHHQGGSVQGGAETQNTGSTEQTLQRIKTNSDSRCDNSSSYLRVQNPHLRMTTFCVKLYSVGSGAVGCSRS